MAKRDGFGQNSASKLTPVTDCSTGRDKMMDWLTAAGDEEGCVNLLKEMELAQDEDDFFYMEHDESTGVQQEMTANQQLQSQQNDQQKKWGPIFNSRQSIRIVLKDKTIMQQAQLMKMKKNLEVPAPATSKLKGNDKQNPFFNIRS
jgi:hypothetical protein